MKNSAFGKNETKLFVRRSMFTLFVLATLVFSNLAQAADLTNGPFDGGPNVQLENAFNHDGAIFSVVDSNFNSYNLQGAPWCYTSYGAYPMMVALPPGVPCHVNVAFPPYVLTGVTGY